MTTLLNRKGYQPQCIQHHPNVTSFRFIVNKPQFRSVHNDLWKIALEVEKFFKNAR